jgi:SAM-dependent methyltransferase
MSNSNNEYWLSRDGSKYQSQQQQRAASDNRMYLQQEQWLEKHLEQRSLHLGRPLRVLEFGCGFGRFARQFAHVTHVQYHGYDFSQAMVQPFWDHPPEGFDISRLRVAPTVAEAFPDEKFDFVFTVSVLIHNAPQAARALVEQMLALLNHDGQLCLLENQLASFDMKENNWHGGCWVHDHVKPHLQTHDITIVRDVAAHQDFYIYEKSSEPPSLTLIRQGQAVAASADEIRLLGLVRLEAAVRGLEAEVADAAALHAEAHDAREDKRELNGRIDALRTQLAVNAARYEAVESVQALRKKLETAVISSEPVAEPDLYEAEAKDKEHLVAPVAPTTAEYEWNALRDTQFSNAHAAFDSVCHVFHLEWFGIRASAGALPGHKLGISAEQPLSMACIDQVITLLSRAGIKKIVVHGFSPSMEAFIHAMNAAGMDQLFLVWHGAPAMWVFDGERKLAQSALRLVRQGRVKRMQGMRRGMDEVIGQRAFAPQLLNIAPKLDRLLLDAKSGKRGASIVFAPSWNLLHKNLITNLLAAQTNPEVDEFWGLVSNLDMDRALSSKLRVLSPRSGRNMLETMRQVDLITNVSLIDCHPMVDQEALAVGTPCLRGPLFLDAMESHPYVRLTEVGNPLSVADISAGMSRVLGVERKEMTDMMADYAQGIRRISFERYIELLELG